MLGYLYTALLQFLPVLIIVFLLAYKRQSVLPLKGGFWFLLFFLFNLCLVLTPKLMLGSLLHWNFVGKILEFTWPLIAIYVFNMFSPAEVGLKWPKHRSDFVLSIGLSLALVLIFALVEFLIVKEPTRPFSVETLLFQFTLPGLSEELLYRGFFLALLNTYLIPGSTTITPINWGIILVSILFIMLHILPFDYKVMWVDASAKELWLTFLSITLMTIVFAYLRIKTDSIWPAVLCHNLVNGLSALLGMAL